ncbi:MAG: sterol carrier protein domain-containing protein, partial [Gammaproteobacteria bacterium]|nr:sterol carrier protein domain-containing protein [Gammaproteobacteria bacterium]
LDVAALGMFEQGYYTRLGFGTGPYQHFLHLDPSDLLIDRKTEVPVRLSVDDYQDVHQAMTKRWKSHGGVNLDPPQIVQAEMGWTEQPFGLGFRNNLGELTHFLWGKGSGETGPYVINAMAYQNGGQLMELLALLSGLSDQVVSVHLREPSHLQLQDLLKTPLRRLNLFSGSNNNRLAASHNSSAYWQLRINNLAPCLAATSLPVRKTLSFNLTLADPIVDYLTADQNWQGAGGEYTVHLGEQCEAVPAHSPGLPLLTAGVPGFSRLWLGSASATALSVVGDIAGPQELIAQLDQILSLPLPKMDWDF